MENDKKVKKGKKIVLKLKKVITIDDLINKAKEFNKKVKDEDIKEAFNFASDKHKGQTRESGEEYITHPLHVAYIIAELGLDTTSIISALLHDTIEDTKTTKEEVEKKFGKDVAEIVDGVTKLGKLKYTSKEERQVENYRKMFLAMGKDLRVILIKLADRLHNMRTLKWKKREKQIKNAKETLNVYAPLANRLGIYAFKGELEDLSFKYLMPEEYHKIIRGLERKKEEREHFLSLINNEIENILEKEGIKAHVEGRVKKIYSIYKKMMRDKSTIDQIYDVFAFRIIVKEVRECYEILGLLHDVYTPIMGRFKDYIALPKQNMYQSIHTTLISKIKEKAKAPFEVQIRTEEMHKVAELGVAAHWAYKEANYKGTKTVVKVKEDKLAWVREIVEWQKDSNDPEAFMEALKTELFDDEVYVYTPAGDIKMLPRGATSIDLAYLIHEEIGNKMIGVNINSRIVPIYTVLQNGDIVEILTSDNSSGPSQDWLKRVVTPGAKNKITRWFKKQNREIYIKKGQEILEQEVKKLGELYVNILRDEYIDKIRKKFNFEQVEDMYLAIGFKSFGINKIVYGLKTIYENENKDILLNEKIKKLENNQEQKRKRKVYTESSGICVPGLENVLVSIAKCCKPVPGDEIFGYITKGRGITAHRKECENAKQLLKDETRIIDIFWAEDISQNYLVDIEVFALNRKELIKEVINITEKVGELNGLVTKVNDDSIKISIKVVVQNNKEINKLLNSLRILDGIMYVDRKR